MSILTLNCGSSSVKYAVWPPGLDRVLCRGLVERVGAENSRLIHQQGDQRRSLERACPDHTAAVGLVLEVLTEGDTAPLADAGAIDAVGHRVVHGGEAFARSARVTPELLGAVERMVELAPLHNPPNLAGMRAVAALLPEVAQVAVFDTAFHQSMPPAAYTYALPHEWYERYGIRRYGFHGTSHLYVAHRAAVLLDRPLAELRLVTLHVGNGASACAVERGRAVDTSMGLTPLEGLVMGTRCGSIDPAIPLHMMQRLQLDAAAMDRVLNKQSGMLGLTGRHVDRRDVLAAAAEGDERCRTALEVEARTLAKTIGAYAAVMGGLDAVVFTAGVGENAPPIRAAALRELAFLGLQLDAGRNQRAVGGAEMAITKPQSPTAALVIPTDEERVIAEDTQAIVQDRYDTPDFHYTFARPD
jgi:acetate kinase